MTAWSLEPIEVNKGSVSSFAMLCKTFTAAAFSYCLFGGGFVFIFSKWNACSIWLKPGVDMVMYMCVCAHARVCVVQKLESNASINTLNTSKVNLRQMLPHEVFMFNQKFRTNCVQILRRYLFPPQLCRVFGAALRKERKAPAPGSLGSGQS